MSMHHRNSRNAGFTLMELLIVVAIIAILVAIAIPTFSGAVEKSREATDVANMRSALAVLAVDSMVFTDGAAAEGQHLYFDGISLTADRPAAYGKGTASSAGVTYAACEDCPDCVYHPERSYEGKVITCYKDAEDRLHVHWSDGGSGDGTGPAETTAAPDTGPTVRSALHGADYLDYGSVFVDRDGGMAFFFMGGTWAMNQYAADHTAGELVAAYPATVMLLDPDEPVATSYEEGQEFRKGSVYYDSDTNTYYVAKERTTIVANTNAYPGPAGNVWIPVDPDSVN